MRYFIVLLLFLSCSCAPVSRKNQITQLEPVPVAKDRIEQKEEKKDTDFLVLDSRTRKEVSVSKLAKGKPVMCIFSIPGCEPCKELISRLSEKIFPRFAQSVVFIVSYPSLEMLPEQDERKEGFIYVASPTHGKTLYPWTLVFDRSGMEAAEIEGEYPVVYYFGLLSELVELK